jgi:hypothetical protein
MQYSVLIQRLNKIGLDKVGGLEYEGHSSVMIGKPSEVVFPFQFQFHTLYRETGQADWPVHEEEIAALRRRFKIIDKDWDATV